ncbi:nuclear transport factor 2 family protein [Confluentibacter flavum]|nr:nuclear transport factor 2 family protein [Confluentibacter flavum]
MKNETSTEKVTEPNITETNRKIVEDFADIFYTQKNVTKAFEKYVSEDYIQHNPNILDGPKAAIDALKPMFDNTEATFIIKQMLVDGDMAMILIHAKKDSTVLGGAVADIYRLEEGKIVEHWDIKEEIPSNAINPHAMFNTEE